MFAKCGQYEFSALVNLSLKPFYAFSSDQAYRDMLYSFHPEADLEKEICFVQYNARPPQKKVKVSAHPGYGKYLQSGLPVWIRLHWR